VEGTDDDAGDRGSQRRALGEVDARLPPRDRRQRFQGRRVAPRLVGSGIEVVGEVLEEHGRELRIEARMRSRSGGPAAAGGAGTAAFRRCAITTATITSTRTRRTRNTRQPPKRLPPPDGRFRVYTMGAGEELEGRL